MKAIIGELWQTGREILLFDNDGFDRIQSFDELKQCENVEFDKKAKLVILDNYFISVSSRKVQHPSGCGSLWVLEVDYYI